MSKKYILYICVYLFIFVNMREYSCIFLFFGLFFFVFPISRTVYGYKLLWR